MSQFDSYLQASYIRNLTAFLGKNHAAVFALQESRPQGHRGRLPRRPDILVKQLEHAVNAKAVRCEAEDTTLAERLELARTYRRLGYVPIAQRLGVSRETVRQWAAGICLPSKIVQLAELLDVPVAWLTQGGGHHLPADSVLGVRVGDESLAARELLYGMTISALGEVGEVGEVADAVAETQMMALLERAVFTDPAMSQAARRAGGRWHLQGGALVFAPWAPIAPHGLARRDWSDEVESLIEEALAKCHSVYAAWHQVKGRCESAGLRYPTRVALHKRIAKARQRAERFGIDLNAQISLFTLQVK